MTLQVSDSVNRPAPTSVLTAILKLLRLRLRISWNSFRHAKLAVKIATILGVIAVMAFGGFIFWLSWLLLNFLHSPRLMDYVGDTTGFIQAVPVLIFAGLFLGILLTSFGVLLQALYLSGDMDFLLAAPVPIRAVFVTKLLQAVLPNFGLIALFGLPVLYGLGLSGKYNPLYYPLVPLMMVMLSLAAAGLAGLLVMLVVRIFHARRVAEVLGFVGAILSIVCSQAGNLANFTSRTTQVSNGQVTGVLDMLERFNNPWIPLNWPGRGLVALGENHWLTGLGLTFLSLILATGLFWISLQIAERWYYTGWAGMQGIAHKKRTNLTTRPALRKIAVAEGGLHGLISQLIPAPILALIRKDYLMMRRDLRHLSQLITPLIFGVIYGFMFLRTGGQAPPGRGEAPAWFMASFETVLSFGNIILTIFVGWMLLQRLAGMGFSQEGRNYWILKSSPLSARQMLMAKFLVAYLPSLVLSTLFLVGYSILQKASISQAAFGLLVVALCLAGMAGIQLAFGAAGANFNWEDPRKMNAGNMGCIGMVLTTVYVPLDLGFFFGPLFLAMLFSLPVQIGYLAGGILGSGFSLLWTILPPKLVERKVERLGEA